MLTAALASPHLQVFGRIDHLVSNAAVNPTAGPILDAPEEAIDKVGHLPYHDVHSSHAAPTYCSVSDQLLHRTVCCVPGCDLGDWLMQQHSASTQCTRQKQG